MVVSFDNEMNFTYNRVRQQSYSEMKNAHYHPYYEIYYLVSGTRKFFIGDTILTLQAGDLIFIPRHIVHRTTYLSDDAPERITMSFSNNLIKKIIEDIGEDSFRKLEEGYKIQIPVGRREYLEELTSKMNLENENTDSLSNAMLTTYLEEMLIFLIRCKEHAAPVSMATASDDETISSAAKYISNHYEENITLESISKMFNISNTYFSKKFKAQTGFGFKEYLSLVRSMEASKLLVDTDLSITEIAEKCGFESSNYFGDAFKKSLGLSPRDYRKSNHSI